MRILIACTHPNVVGGIETYLRDLLPALHQRGHALALLTGTTPLPGAASIMAHVPHLPTWNLAERGRNAALQEVESWKPDVACVHGLETPADEQALIERFPAVLVAHGHNGTCVSGTRTVFFPRARPCDRRFGPACLLHYFPRRCGGANPLTMLRLYSANRRRARLLPRYQAVIVTSRSMVEEYRTHGVSEERLYRLPLFPTSQLPDPAPPPIRAPRDRVLMVGRLYKEKGPCLLVEAMGRANAALGRTVTLVVAGNGPEQPRMAALAARLRVPVEYHGWVDAERRTALMRDADLLAIPSVCPETFGLVGVEAGCVGLPAVAFAVGGIPDWLVPGQSGELAPADPPTARGLAAAIMRALSKAVHRRSLAAGAWETARTYSSAKHVARLEAVLERAVTGDHRR